MANARKIIKQIGGQKKKKSVRRSSSSRRRSNSVMPTWKYVAIAALVTAGMLLLAYPMLKEVFEPMKTNKRQTAYGSGIPAGYSVYGIDISHHQGVIDWDLLKEGKPGTPPVSFVYMKATEGSSHCDTRYCDNWEKAKSNGFKRGAYHYFSTQSPGEKQARMFISKVKLEPGDLPPMVDVEEEPENADAFRKELAAFIETIEEHYKVKPIIYTYAKFYEPYFGSKQFGSYPLWIAHYDVEYPEIDEEWLFWQCTENGTLPGIGRKVDINVFNGSFEELQRMGIR